MITALTVATQSDNLSGWDALVLIVFVCVMGAVLYAVIRYAGEKR